MPPATKLKNRLSTIPEPPVPALNGHRNGTNGTNGHAAAPARNGVHAPTVARPWTNPTQLDRPSFLMNFPFSLATAAPNNPWMRDLKGSAREPDHKRVAIQFLELYRGLSAEGLVYLLPTPRNADLQDLVYSANLGIVLEHLPDRNTVVISNFASPPRQGETVVGVRFFEDLGYNVHVAPAKFEGEAELKHVRDNVYIGGYGIRSERETYDWMERKFDMRIIKVRETEPYLYHLDCSIFPITKENLIVCTDLFTKKEVAELAKVANVIPVTIDEAFSGICNSVRLPNQVLNASHIHDLKAGTSAYQEELRKNRRLEDIASNLALEVGYFNLSEYHKSGALLSCMVMHLNRHCYKIALTA
ncbi:MAG TPA: amidinotransferase [Planctomycetota bacterium]|nr:amidinotransferase [Planctomycetota bacterium]